MLVRAPVIEHYQVASEIFFMKMKAPEISSCAVPGQFIHVKCGDFYDPLLRRPFSLCRIEPEAGTISILYEIRGRGTLLMSKLRTGQELDVMGPLGKGFEIAHLRPEHTAVLVGGGIGSAPLVALAPALADNRLKETIFLLGAKTKNGLLPQEMFEGINLEFLTATEDGSIGLKGLVTHLLPLVTEKGEEFISVFACGPTGMLKSVAQYCVENGLPCQVSLEALMACGVGACQGCVCKVRISSFEDYARVCKEGPVFSAGEVVWDE